MLTRRNVDPGALINAGGTGKELFDIARVDPLRVYVNVPQAYAPAIKNGMEAWVTLQEFPGQKFKGTVARTAESIDPTTRTLLTEVDVPNKDGHLLPGSFGEVHFKPGINGQKVTRAGQYHALPPGRPARGGRRQRQQSATAAHHHWPRLRHARWRLSAA